MATVVVPEEPEDLQEEFMQLQHEKHLILRRQAELEAIWQDAEEETAHQQELIVQLEKRLREHEKLAEQRAEERALAAKLEQELEDAQQELERTKHHLNDTRSELSDMKTTLAVHERDKWEDEDAADGYASSSAGATARELAALLAAEEQRKAEMLLMGADDGPLVDPELINEQQEEIRRLRDRLDEEEMRSHHLATELERKASLGQQGYPHPASNSLAGEVSLASELEAPLAAVDAARLEQLEQDLADARQREEQERLAREQAEHRAAEARQQIDAEKYAREAAEARAAEARAHAETEIARAAAQAAHDSNVLVEREAAARLEAIDREREAMVEKLVEAFPMFERSLIREVLIEQRWNFDGAFEALTKRHLRLQKQQQGAAAAASPKQLATPKKQMRRHVSGAELRRQELIRKKQAAKQRAEEEEQRRLEELAENERAARQHKANARRRQLEQRRARLLEEQRARQQAERLPGMLVLQCPVCEMSVSVFPGQKVACPSCQTVFGVPEVPTQSGDFAITMPSQDKSFQVKVNLTNDARKLGVGAVVSENCVLKFTTSAVALLSLGAHDAVMEWPISRIKSCSANKGRFELVAWVDRWHRLATMQFLTEENAVMLKALRKIINKWTERKDSFLARDMQKEELVDVVDLTEDFLADLRLDEEFNRILARETRTGFDELQKVDDATFSKLLGQMGKDSRRAIRAVRKRSKASARRLGLKREPRLRPAIQPLGTAATSASAATAASVPSSPFGRQPPTTLTPRRSLSSSASFAPAHSPHASVLMDWEESP